MEQVVSYCYYHGKFFTLKDKLLLFDVTQGLFCFDKKTVEFKSILIFEVDR